MKKTRSTSQYSRGFTIIEIVVIIVVIGILAIISAVEFNRYHDQSLDAQREANVTVVAQGLEKYHEKNGVYPGCDVMTGSATTLADTLQIDASVLKSPRGNAENSFFCAALDSGDDTDIYGYVGDGTAGCLAAGSCAHWTIQYWNDETGTIDAVESKHSAEDEE